MNDTFFNEESFKRIIEHAPIGIVIIDKEFRWRMINSRFTEITGYKKKELIGKTFIDITYEEDRDQNLALYDKLKNGTIPEYSFEKRYVRKDGKIIWVKLTVAGVRIEGEYSHLIALIQDVDETRKYQNEILYKNKELDTLFYKASHDLKSPIKTLEGLYQILKSEGRYANEDETIYHLGETINKLRTQNESLLQLVKINEVDPKLKSVQPFDVIKRCAQTLDGLELSVKGPANLKLRTDPYFLELIFTKLLHNSIRYSSSKNIAVQVNYRRQAKAHCFTLTDDSDGITPDVRDHIFEMFFKGNEKSKGSGLGLYIVKKAIQKLGGEITVADRKPKGSIFSLTFPLN